MTKQENLLEALDGIIHAATWLTSGDDIRTVLRAAIVEIDESTDATHNLQPDMRLTAWNLLDEIDAHNIGKDASLAVLRKMLDE